MAQRKSETKEEYLLRVKEYNAKRRVLFPEEIKKRKQEHYARNKERIKARSHNNYHANIEQKRNDIRVRAANNLGSWAGVVPDVTNCQICGKEVRIHARDHKDSIAFDHRHGGNEPIQGSPKHWLRANKRTTETEKIWRECDFGYLCRDCNRYIPTKNRIQFALNLNKYLGIRTI